MLQVAGQLFGVTVEAADGKAPVWNSDVRFFCIKQDGKPRAYFFFVSFCQPSCLMQPCFYVFQHCIMHITSTGLWYVVQKLLGVAWSPAFQQLVATGMPCCTQQHIAVMNFLLLWGLHRTERKRLHLVASSQREAKYNTRLPMCGTCIHCAQQETSSTHLAGPIQQAL